MSKGSRYRDVAFGLAISLVAGVFALGVVDLARNQAYRDSYNEQAAARENRYSQTALSLCARLPPIEREVCVHNALTSQRDQQRANYDLHAQMGMREAAFWMFMIGGFQAIAGVVGLYFVARTLDKSNEAVVAAQEANTHASKVAEAEFRPWLASGGISVAAIAMNNGLLSIELDISVENKGRSPALHVMATCKLVRVRSNVIWTPDAGLEEFCQRSRRTVVVGQNIGVFPKGKQTLQAKDTEPVSALSVVPPSTSIYLFVCISYRSAGHRGLNVGEPFHTGFVVRLHFSNGIPADGSPAIVADAFSVEDSRDVYNLS